MTIRRTGSIPLALIGLLAGCAAAYHSAQPGDSDLLAAALQFFARRDAGAIRMDPRPLRPDARLQGITTRDLAVTDESVVRARTEFARSRGIATTDAAADMSCAFARGVPPPDSMLRLEPDSIRTRRQACLARGLYTTYVFGVARPARAPSSDGTPRVVLRAVRMTTSGFDVWDLEMRPNERGGYEVAGARRLGGVSS